MRHSSGFGHSALLSALVLLAPAQAGAQGWVADVAAGHAAYEAVASSVATTGLTLGLRHEGSTWFRLAAGVPLDSTGLPWAALGLGNRFSTRAIGLSFGLDAGGHGFAYSDGIAAATGGGLAAETMALGAARVDALRLELRSGVQHYTSYYAGTLAGRTAQQTDARVSYLAPNLTLTGESRYVRAAEASYPFVGGALEFAGGPLVVIAHGGRWLSKRVETPLYGAHALLRVNRRTDVHLRFRQETTDPLHWNTPRQSWSLGLAHRLGSVPLAPLPRAAPVLTERGVTFRLPSSASDAPPSVAGQFSGWQSVQMARVGDFWSVTIPVRRGVYRYAFRDADGNWFVPEGVPGREADGYGGTNAVLIVP